MKEKTLYQAKLDFGSECFVYLSDSDPLNFEQDQWIRAVRGPNDQSDESWVRTKNIVYLRKFEIKGKEDEKMKYPSPKIVNIDEIAVNSKFVRDLKRRVGW